MTLHRLSIAGLILAAVVLGGVWTVLLGFAASCVAADRLIPMPYGTAAEADRVFSLLLRRRRWARRMGRTRPLDVLEDVHPWTRTAQRRDLGVRAIPITSLAGTVEPFKARQFDRDWRPDGSARARWVPLWLGRRSGSPIPAISVFRVGDAHWVRDGHHRVSVARHQDAPSIEAEVDELLDWSPTTDARLRHAHP
jgi:hypothetical protein